MSNVHPIMQEALAALDPTKELLRQLPADKKPLAVHRPASVICAAIKSESLTLNEVGNILGAVTDRICAEAYGTHPVYPEMQEVADQLAEICETAYPQAQSKIDERLYEEHLRSNDRE